MADTSILGLGTVSDRPDLLCGTHLRCRAGMVRGDWRQVALHCTQQADAKWVRRELQMAG